MENTLSVKRTTLRTNRKSLGKFLRHNFWISFNWVVMIKELKPFIFFLKMGGIPKNLVQSRFLVRVRKRLELYSLEVMPRVAPRELRHWLNTCILNIWLFTCKSLLYTRISVTCIYVFLFYIHFTLNIIQSN